MLFLFRALAHIQATLKSLKTIIWGRWSKVHSVSDITERESFTQRQTQGERRRETSGKGGIMDEISCEKGGN